MRSERLEFAGGRNARLVGRLDSPEGDARAQALFAHCFTCGKDSLAAGRISLALGERGIATLRFDFTGLGGSDGEFANTGFSSNVDDLVAAADHLRAIGRPPTLLIGHSLGGAAVLAAAERIPEAKAVAVIAAPFEVVHVVRHFADRVPEIETAGEAAVRLGGRTFKVRKSFLEDVRAQDQGARIAKLGRALLVLHAPLDAVVGVEDARLIFERARHPKSFVALDGADHLLGRRADAAYAAAVIAAWAGRYLPQSAPSTAAEAGTVTVEETGNGRFEQAIAAGPHRLIADEPIAVGGADRGPGPYDLLLAALGACTSMTLRLYAERKGMALGQVRVALRHRKIHAADCAACETQAGKLDEIERVLTVAGELDAEQRARLLEIADKCPVHRTLQSEIRILTTLGE